MRVYPVTVTGKNGVQDILIYHGVECVTRKHRKLDDWQSSRWSK